jgi:transposase
MGGRRPFALAGERDFVHARLAEKPDITLRALLVELAERGVKVSYYAVWHFCAREGFTFKKNPARQRAGPARRGGQTRALAPPPGKT